MDETVDKLSRLHSYDCLRCNKAMRVPRVWNPAFQFWMPNFWTGCHEFGSRREDDSPRREDRKVGRRKADDTPDDPYLPNKILRRQKEQFSDGVGYGWVDYLKDEAEKEITDQMFANAKNRFPHNTPSTKEGYRYRMIFEEFFPGEAAEQTVPGGKSIACSTERAMNWDKSFALRADPSGRAAGVHASAYGDNFEAATKLEPPTKKTKV